MSHALYATCLIAGRRGGVAKLHWRIVHLDAPPDLGGGAPFALDYVPQYGRCRIEMWGCQERDMTPAEISAADALLSAICK